MNCPLNWFKPCDPDCAWKCYSGHCAVYDLNENIEELKNQGERRAKWE